MKRAFLDPTTKILKAWGFVQTNEPGDVILEVPEDFALEVDKWRWDGVKFVPHTPLPPPDRKAKARAAISKVPAGPQRDALDSLLEII